jgi:hypothetical protein
LQDLRTRTSTGNAARGVIVPAPTH